MDVPGTQGVVEETLVQHHPHLRLGLPLLGEVVIAHEGNGARVPAHQVQDAFDGGGLARAVLADQPQNGAAGEGQVHILQGKVPIGLAQAGYFNTICHNQSP